MWLLKQKENKNKNKRITKEKKKTKTFQKKIRSFQNYAMKNLVCDNKFWLSKQTTKQQKQKTKHSRRNFQAIKIMGQRI